MYQICHHELIRFQFTYQTTPELNSIQFDLFDVYRRGRMTFVNKQNNAKGHQGRRRSALTSAQTRNTIIQFKNNLTWKN